MRTTEKKRNNFPPFLPDTKAKKLRDIPQQ